MSKTRDRPVSVLIGGGSGIGEACARHLARRGDLVVVIDPGAGVEGEELHENTAAMTASAIRRDGGEAIHAETSVTDRQGLESLFDQVRCNHGEIGAVVDTAGILRFPPLVHATQKDWSDVLEVHVSGFLNVLRVALPGMIDSGRGAIVGFTSGVGLARTSPGNLAYGVAKRAVAGITWELGSVTPSEVRVNALAPIAGTRMVRAALVAGGAQPGGVDLTAMPQAEDMAPAVEWLTSERSGWLSGQVIFSAGSEISLIEPPRLIEACRARDVPDLQTALDTIVPVLLSPAERSQRTGGGSNPRMHDAFSDVRARSRPDGRTNWLVVADDPRLSIAIGDAVRPWGHSCIMKTFGASEGSPARHPDRFTYAERELASAEAQGSVGGVICVSNSLNADDDSSARWQSVLRSHESVTSAALEHAAWLRAAACLSSRSGRPIRTVHVVRTETPGGRTLAQSVAQMCRSANQEPTTGQLLAFSVAYESSTNALPESLGLLIARLGSADDTLSLAGAELLVASDWIGLYSHPTPTLTCTLGPGDIPAGLDSALRRAMGAGPLSDRDRP